MDLGVVIDPGAGVGNNAVVPAVGTAAERL